jgi:hypothetical protein
MSGRGAPMSETLERLVSRAAAEQPDWNDVLDRVEGARRQRIRVAAAVLGLCTLVLAATASAYGPKVWDLVAGGEVDPGHPVLDRSIVEVTREKTNPHIFRLQGFAADIVKEVALRRANGDLVARTPVRDNVYLRSTGLPDDTDTIVALDASGRQIWSNCPPVRPNSDEEGC